MPVWLTIVLALGGSAFITLIVRDIYQWVKNGSKKAKEIKKNERQDEIREVVHEALEPLHKDINEIKEQTKLTSAGTCAGLRSQLLNFYYYCDHKGYRTPDDSENFQDLYDAYTALGGNSFIQRDVYNWFQALPIKRDNSKKGE